MPLGAKESSRSSNANRVLFGEVNSGAAQSREWRPSWPCPVRLNTAHYRHGSGDPTFAIRPDGAIVMARRTPVGVATMRITSDSAAGLVQATAWGPGAEWALDTLPRLLGADDDPTGFEPAHPALVRPWRRFQHWRIGASECLFDSLLPTILEQKVTGQEAYAGYRGLVNRFGEPAPGPEDLGVRLAPHPAALRAIPSWEWLKLPVDQTRSRTILYAAKVVGSLDRATTGGIIPLTHALESIPGIGRWTSAEVRARVLGDADAVSLGDYHVAKDVGWALTGAAVDDDGLEVLLERYRPHRLRVQGLVALAGLGHPRRGSRMAPRRHLPGGYS